MKHILTKLSLIILTATLTFALPENVENQLTPGPLPAGRPSVALVLAGGGAKGFAHLPVIELIESMDIPIDMIVGTSIGSIIGGIYASGYSTTEIVKNFKDVNWSDMFNDSAKNPYENALYAHSLNSNLVSLNFDMDFSLKMGTGLSNGQNIYQVLKNLTLKYPSNINFDSLEIPFRAVVTDMLTGNSMVLKEGDIAEAIRASMSLPSIFAPYEIDGYHFMDGGIRYNLAINVAKKMGYDIIIAVDISQKVRDNPEVYSSNPAVAMLNTITISQYSATEKMYKDADLVVFPDISKFGTLDFKKADYIYNEGKKILPQYEQPLEEIRKRIYPNDYTASGQRISPRKEITKRGSYRKKANIIPTNIKIDGALDADKKFIENGFKKLFDNELTPKNLSEFMDLIYLTGNYDSVRPRIICEGEEVTLEVLLKKKQQKEMKFVGGLEFAQTIAPTSLTMFDLYFDYQLRGLTGPGSVIAFGAKAINDFTAQLYYMQPFNPYIFSEVILDVKDKRFPQMPLSITATQEPEYANEKQMEADLALGFRTDHGNLFKFGAYYFYRKSYWNQSLDSTLISYPYNVAKENGTEDQFIADLGDDYSNILNNRTIQTKDFGAYLAYTLDKLDRSMFPTKGIYMSVEGDLDFCYTSSKVYDPALVASVDFQGAIPVTKKMSVLSSIYLGADVTGNMMKSPYLVLGAGLNAYDRFYFPQITNENRIGSHKIVAQLAVQFQPWSQLTILGGDAIIRVSGSVGNVTSGFNKMIPTGDDASLYPILWNANAGFGVRIKENYSVFLRAGAANKEQGKVFPFVSLDIGSIRF